MWTDVLYTAQPNSPDQPVGWAVAASAARTFLTARKIAKFRAVKNVRQSLSLDPPMVGGVAAGTVLILISWVGVG